jgi:hypothetical protein
MPANHGSVDRRREGLIRLRRARSDEDCCLVPRLALHKEALLVSRPVLATAVQELDLDRLGGSTTRPTHSVPGVARVCPGGTKPMNSAS